MEASLGALAHKIVFSKGLLSAKQSNKPALKRENAYSVLKLRKGDKHKAAAS